ncbi:MAG: hypothetical protein Q9M20_01245 [Mariprofundaceae bacterium]|nr:hypothetical protein [Mariprofundaceae bacterium]
MRLKFLLFIALLLTIVLTLFPDIALQILRIEAFGWQFETRQGAFIVAVLLILAALWLIQRLLSALVAGPGQLWQTLRMGSKKRREQRLREGISQWLDMRDDYGQRVFKKTRGIVPSWLSALLQRTTIPANEQDLPASDADPLLTTLAARIATSPEASPKPDLAIRKAHLEAWLHSQPNAPLALMRMADLAVEEEDWKRAAHLLEDIWKRGHRSASFVKSQLVHAWLALAAQETAGGMEYLRKAHRIMPDHSGVILALGQAQMTDGKQRTTEKLWLNHLQKNHDIAIANATFEMLKNNALAAFRKLEKQQGSASLQWLQARLAYAGKLDGLADEHLSNLLKEHPCRAFWQTQAEWMIQRQQWQEALAAYQKALDYSD